MKRILFHFILLSGLIAHSSILLARVGTDSSGGGGNGTTAEFVELVSNGLHALANRGVVEVNGRTIDFALMALKLRDAKILTSNEPLSLNGANVNAINYPETGEIVIDAKAWARLKTPTKLQLALHELWGLAYHDGQDDRYQFSKGLKQIIVDAGFESPGRITSIVTSNQDGRAQTFRAIISRRGGQTRSNLDLIFQKIKSIEVNGKSVDLVTSSVVYTPTDFPYGEDSVIENMTWGRSANGPNPAFRFELSSMSGVGVKTSMVSFELPEHPAHEEIRKQDMFCRSIFTNFDAN